MRRLAIPLSAVFIAIAQSAEAQGVLLRSFSGELFGADFGHSVAVAGDVDADGTPDLLVGAPSHDPNALPVSSDPRRGRAYVFSGDTGAAIRVIDGQDAGDEVGGSLAGVGDVNGDEHADFALGSSPLVPPGSGELGRVKILSGLTGTSLYMYEGAGVNTGFGTALEGVGDVDGDGTPDFAIGEPRVCTAPPCGATPDGAVYVFSGATGALARTWTGAEEGKTFLGSSVAGGGDVDNDGRADVLIGAGGVLSDDSTAYAFSGMTGELIHSFGAFLVMNFDGAGDVDDDGFDDVLISGGAGAAVFSGASGLPFYLIDPPGLFIGSAASAGDVNGDAVPDIAVSTDSGTFVYNGGSGAFLSSIPTPAGSLSGVGDVDADGLSDIAMGDRSLRVPPAGTIAGGAFIFAIKGPCTDFDGDGRGAPLTAECGFADPDCDDFDAANFPGNAEVCDGRDNDCDGLFDEPLADADGDGWGNACDCAPADPAVNAGVNEDGDGFTACNDCRDDLPFVYPGRPEAPGNGYDDDCDGQTDELCGSIPAESSGVPWGALLAYGGIALLFLQMRRLALRPHVNER